MDFDKLRFIRKLVLIAIFSDDDLMDTFVVKGGSAIDLIYKLDARASVDIDLSMENDFSEAELAVVKQKSLNLDVGSDTITELKNVITWQLNIKDYDKTLLDAQLKLKLKDDIDSIDSINSILTVSDEKSLFTNVE